MKRVEDLLREEFRRRDPGVPTSRDEMLARVARVRRRRSAATAGLATVVVGVAAAVAVGLHGSTGQSVGGGGDTGTPQYTGELTNVIFTDASHGYVLQEYCGLVLPPAGPTVRRAHAGPAPAVPIAAASDGRRWAQLAGTRPAG